jgi:Outer membrane protein beta-barrel domain
MKSSMRFAFLVCLMLSVTNMQAQIRFGPKVGLNLSKMTLKNSGIAADPKTLVGFHIGVISEIPLKGNFVLQPALLYSSKGSKYSFMGEEESISPGFLEIPVNATYKFDLGNMKFFLNAGPYFAYGISGKIKYGGESHSIKFGTDDNADMKPFDMGLNFGAGLEIQNFLVSLNYEFGLTNLIPGTTDGSEAKSQAIGISVGYLFGKK